jgi:aminopeptidase N
MDHPDEYWVVYWQGACMLATLADTFGLNRFLEILHDYAATHWFGVATTADVRAAFEAAATEDGIVLGDAFWERWRVSLDGIARPVRGRGGPPAWPLGGFE